MTSTQVSPRSRRRSLEVSRRQQKQANWSRMTTERSSWMSNYQELSDFLLPWSGRMFIEDRNRGNGRHGNIYDSSGTMAVTTLAAGLQAGASSPARPWFRIGTDDPELDKQHNVAVWLNVVADLMRSVMGRSNTYRTLHGMYEELGVFGTSGSICLPDEATVIHHYPVTCGEFCIAQNYKGQVDTIYREYQMTVAQLVDEFGLENCSNHVQELWQRGNNDHDWVTVIHAIEPNTFADDSKLDNRAMPYTSCYFEVGTDDREPDRFLSDSGFKRFRALVPRWQTSGRDIYGNSPGMLAINDIKGLQHKQVRKAEAINYKTKPSLQGPTSLQGREVEMLPGGYTGVDSPSGQRAVTPMWEVQLELNDLREDIADQRMLIHRAFSADLFRMLQNSVDQSKTATEVAILQEEKMILLGPVLERLQTELHEPLIDMLFETMWELGMIPTPPPAMRSRTSGVGLRVEFISLLAQAQKKIGTTDIDRFTMHLGTLRDLGHPDVIDLIDADKSGRHYADILGVPATLLRSPNGVTMIRTARNKAKAAADQANMMATQAKTARDLASAPTGANPNALTDVMSSLSGYNYPAAQAVG